MEKRTKRLSLARGGVNGRIGKVKTVHVGVGGPSQWCDLPEEPLADKDVHLFKSPEHHRNWLDCIKTRKDPICTASIGARSAEICHLANIGYALRRKLTWTGDWRRLDNRFENDDEANKLLDYTMRSPWSLT